jgi:hypothetical protein
MAARTLNEVLKESSKKPQQIALVVWPISSIRVRLLIK